MNGYDLIMLVQKKMKDPKFEANFNKIANEFNNIPGLQKEVMRIAQINDEKKRQKAIDKLPGDAKKLVKELLQLLNS